MMINSDVSNAMTVKLDDILSDLPPAPEFAKKIRRAPKRNFVLSEREIRRKRRKQTSTCSIGRNRSTRLTITYHSP